MRRRRLGAVVAGLSLGGLPLLGLPGVSGTHVAVAAADSSAVTVSGTGPFSSLKVTVSQTTGLTDQVVQVSWTGATPTFPPTGGFQRHYLQLMQCWGDDPAGPTRDHCEFGASTDSRGGFQANSRQVNYGSELVDPAETIKPPAGSLTNVYVPFTGVNGVTVPGDPNSNTLFNSFDTNEDPYGRTYPSGTGNEFFEVLTAQQAPGLGCGTASLVNGERVGRRCWLVIVPRDDHEVDGTTRDGASDQVNSSPLSQTNWDHRLVVPLEFQPIGLSCPIGTPEKRTLGQEAVAEAIGRWQPTLCENTGDVYGYSDVSDDAARRELASATPNLVFLGGPPGPGDATPAGSVTYAPVTLSGLGIAFVVERQSPLNAPAEVKALDGSRLPAIKLTARLVAKLLTQSYVFGVNNEAASHLVGNPVTLTKDPEFLALNPGFSQLSTQLAEVLEPVGLSDAVTELWTWIDGDPQAKAFLAGIPDEHGMTINPFYKDLDLPRSDLPRNDPTCHPEPPYPPVCPLDEHPYVNDFHDAARSLNRGEGGGRVYDPLARPPAFKKGPAALSGTKAALGLADSASAARYSLVMASLRNASGEFVTPTDASLLAAFRAMKPSATPGVLTADPATTEPGAYPLPLLSYAATVPSALTPDQGRAYAAFLRYVAGPGQSPGLTQGLLPAGYTPLPLSARAQSLAAADHLEEAAGHPDPVPAPSPAAAPTPPSASAAPSPAPSSARSRPRPTPRAGAAVPREARPSRSPAPVAALGSVAASPATAPAPAVAPLAAPPAQVQVTGTLSRTPAVDAGPARFVFLGALAVGALAALIRPALSRARRPGPWR